MTAVKFKDKNEIYFYLCDCCEEETASRTFVWEEKDFAICFECIKRLFTEFVLDSDSINNGESIVVSRKTIPESLRNKIFNRDGWKCVECGDTHLLCIDHVFPFSLGGTTEESNLRTLCRSCNLRKGNRVYRQG